MGSLVISILLVRQAFLSHQLNQEQRTLQECQEAVSQGAAYENAWKELAVNIYQSSAQDPTLAAILRAENVGVRAQPAGPTSSAAGAPGSPTSPVPAKAPATPIPKAP